MKKYNFILILIFSLIITEVKAQISCPSLSNPLAGIPIVTIANLPTCNAGSNGLIYQVTNALAPIVAALPIAGGLVTTLVHCNGTIFVVG